jgi:hypothetical protein
MKRLLLAAIVAMAASGPAWAQSSTATGTGVGVARSTSRSQAISGQGGTGVGVGGNPSATITTNSTVPADQTVKNVPSVVAPGLAAAGLETCLGSVSGGGAFVGTGFSFGTTIPDPGCAARLDARTLGSMGLKKAAVARLCLNSDIYRAMPEVCDQYLPQPAPGDPAPPPVPTRYALAEASEEQPYTGGDIWLVEGATGKNRLCNDYDVTEQRCRVWAHTVDHSAPKKKATASGETSHTAASQLDKRTGKDGKTRPATATAKPASKPKPAPAPAATEPQPRKVEVANTTPTLSVASSNPADPEEVAGLVRALHTDQSETEKKEKSQVERIERVDLRHEHLLPSLSLYNHHCSSLPLLPFLGLCAARTVFATTTM